MIKIDIQKHGDECECTNKKIYEAWGVIGREKETKIKRLNIYFLNFSIRLIYTTKRRLR